MEGAEVQPILSFAHVALTRDRMHYLHGVMPQMRASGGFVLKKDHVESKMANVVVLSLFWACHLCLLEC